MSAAIRVIGSYDGAVVVGLALPHGASAEGVLAEAGWVALEVTGSSGRLGADLAVHYAVRPVTMPASADGLLPGGPLPMAPRVDPDIDLDREPILVRQRVAAYAVVSSARGWLLTELSDRTRMPGWWTLPGGGLDEGEDPRAATVREVWEETGQRVELGPLVGFVTRHWVGRDDGLLQDHHAVRFVYRGWCAEPTEPVVHDVGGSTRSAIWADATALAQLPVVDSWAEVLPQITGVRRSSG